jgi:hypothetical protein
MEEERSTLAISFLDVLSCGLGAAILLFLVFSVLPHQGVSQSSGERDLVAGLGAEIRELGVDIDDKDEVRSFNSTVLLKFLVTDTENKGLTAEELDRAVKMRGVTPNLKFKGSSPGDLVARDVFEIVDPVNVATRTICMRISIPGGQARGCKIRFQLKREPSLIGSCHLFVGNTELTSGDDGAINSSRSGGLVVTFNPGLGEKYVAE